MYYLIIINKKLNSVFEWSQLVFVYKSFPTIDSRSKWNKCKAVWIFFLKYWIFFSKIIRKFCRSQLFFIDLKITFEFKNAISTVSNVKLYQNVKFMRNMQIYAFILLNMHIIITGWCGKIFWFGIRSPINWLRV